MRDALPHEYHRDLDRAYIAGDLDAAIQSLTRAFKKRGDSNPKNSIPAIEPMRDFIPLDEITSEHGAKVVTDWRSLAVNIAPEGETAEDFLSAIRDQEKASNSADLV